MTALFLWTIVGFAGTQFSTHEKRDWRYSGSFDTSAACHEAAKQLGQELKTYRCISIKTGATQ